MDTSAGATVAFATAVLAVSVGWLLLGSRKRVPTQPAKPPPALAPETKRGPMLVLWGSQTGTAEGFATTLEREACERGFAAQAMDLEVCEPFRRVSRRATSSKHAGRVLAAARARAHSPRDARDARHARTRAAARRSTT